MFTAIPTIAIGSCFGFLSSTRAASTIKSTLIPPLSLHDFSVLLISPVPGPKLSRRMQGELPNSMSEIGNALASEDTTRSQLTGCTSNISTTASTSNPEVVRLSSNSPVFVERIGAISPENSGNLIARCLMSFRTCSRADASSDGE